MDDLEDEVRLNKLEEWGVEQASTRPDLLDVRGAVHDCILAIDQANRLRFERASLQPQLPGLEDARYWAPNAFVPTASGVRKRRRKHKMTEWDSHWVIRTEAHSRETTAYSGQGRVYIAVRQNWLPRHETAGDVVAEFFPEWDAAWKSDDAEPESPQDDSGDDDAPEPET